jgi:hypothetical protein
LAHSYGGTTNLAAAHNPRTREHHNGDSISGYHCRLATRQQDITLIMIGGQVMPHLGAAVAALLSALDGKEDLDKF